MKKLRIASIVVVMALVASAPTVLIGRESEFQIVVHPSHGGEAIDIDALSKIFLKKGVKARPDGVVMQPIDQAIDLPIRQAFTRAVHGRSVDSVRSFWQRRIFSGRGTPPPTARTDAEVIDFVRGNIGGIGYVSVRADIKDAKVVLLAERSSGRYAPQSE